jgi:hypothetical protein
MSRLTLRLPETLHRTLAQQAQDEGVSLNQLIVYLLTRVSTAFDLGEQRRGFEELLQKYPQEEAEHALQEILAARS